MTPLSTILKRTSTGLLLSAFAAGLVACFPLDRAWAFNPADRAFSVLGGVSLQNLVFDHNVDTEKYQQVTKQYGPTVIDLSTLPYASPVLDSGKRAWSSWWFQKSKREFDGDPQTSILAKYDAAFGTNGTPQSALKDEFAHEKSQYAVWEGLCDAWALASLFYDEPKRPVVFNHQSFSVAELKGLVLKTFEATPDSDFTVFGEKFLGNAEAWMYPDLFPDQFHRFIEVALGQKHQVFLMDRDPGVEVWTVPVYKANFRMELKAGDPRTVVVKTWLFTAGSSAYEDRNKVGTDEVVFEYAYELSGDLSPDGRYLTVTGGEWIRDGLVDSRENHPDYVLLPKSNSLHRASYNRFIDPAKVDRLVKGSL